MIPLRGHPDAPRFSPVNTILIALNAGAFAVQLSGAAADDYLVRLGMTPAAVAHPLASAATLLAPASLVTSLFIHGGWLHLLGNLFWLYVFGPAVEMRFGSWRYLGFYLVSGIAAGIAMVLMEPDSMVPVVGASGAIAGVLGAYFILYPRSRILTVLPLPMLIEFIEVPAVLYLLLWFGLQLWGGLTSSGAGGSLPGGVAWWSHVGGFLFGVAAAPLLTRAPARRRRAKQLW